MADTIQCPGCGKQYPLNPKYLGKEVRCKTCGRVFVAPAGVNKPDPIPVARLIDDEPAAPVAKIIEPSTSPLPQGLPTVESANNLPPLQASLQPVSQSGWHSRKNSGSQRPSWGRRLRRYRVAIGATVGVLIGGMLLWLIGAGFISGIRSGIASKPAVPLRDADLPDRGPMHSLGAGVCFCEVDLGVPSNQPGHMDKLHVYLPEGHHANGSLPCVVIAPGGSSLINGIELTDGDRIEHLPYVQAGFAVVAYELDGNLENPDSSRIWQTRRAIEQYWAAECGLVNARNALQYISAKVPEVDTCRIYSAGHSSAATMALLLAEHDQRIHGCVAYAPVTNLRKRFANDLAMFRNKAPRAIEIIDKWSPHQSANRMDCPVMLFHARDDGTVPCSESTEFADLLKQHGKNVTLELVDYGDHYNAMIRQGIPKGIEWLAQIDGRVKPPCDATTGSLAKNKVPEDIRRMAGDPAAWGSSKGVILGDGSDFSDQFAEASLEMELMQVGISRPRSESGWESVAKICKKHGARKMVAVEMTIMGDDKKLQSYKAKLERAVRAAGARDVYTEVNMINITIWAGPVADLAKLSKRLAFGRVLFTPISDHRKIQIVVTPSPNIAGGPGNTKWPEGEFPPMGGGGPPRGLGPDGMPKGFPPGMHGPPRRMRPRGMRGRFPR